MSKVVLFRTIFKREWLEWKRYPFNLVSSFLTVYLIFLAIFYGFKFLGNGMPSQGETLDSIIVGFMLWIFAMMAYSSLSWSLIEEARTGTLEQLYMTPMGFKLVCLFRVISSFILNLLFIIPVLFLMMITTGRYLHIDPFSLLPLLIFSLASVYGIGFMVGGLALVFKQIQAFFQILQWIFLGFIAAPIYQYSTLKALPLSLGFNLINEVMSKNLSFFKLSSLDLVLLILNGAFYFCIGLFVFNICERVAKSRGLLGHY
jgi:ABC-2 type transport system permease protein